MFVAAAVCPHPPLLVPAPGVSDPGIAPVRDACRRAVAELLRAHPEIVVVVGSGPSAVDLNAAAGGSLQPYGFDVRAGGPESRLPLSLTVGSWLLDRADDGPTPVARRYFAVPDASAPHDCFDAGVALSAGERRVGLLVMGDGSARRTTASPGSYDARGVAFDASVESALRTGDVAAVMRLDPVEARQLWVAGRAAWQVLAGAASRVTGLEADLLTAESPYGVGYFVATWTAAKGRPAAPRPTHDHEGLRGL